MKLSNTMDRNSMNTRILHNLRLPGLLIGLGLLIAITIIHFIFPVFDQKAGALISVSLQGRGYFFFDKVTELGNVSFILPAAFLLLLFLLAKKSWERSIQLLLTVFGGAAFGFLLKLIYSQARLFSDAKISNELDFGFPSGHTMMAFLFYGWIAFLAMVTIKSSIWKWASVLTGIFLIFSIGISRLMINVHLPTDVLSGWLAGSIWLIISSWLSAWVMKNIILRISKKEPFF